MVLSYILYFAWNVELWNDTFIFFYSPYPFQLLKILKKKSNPLSWRSYIHDRKIQVLPYQQVLYKEADVSDVNLQCLVALKYQCL